MTYVPLYQFRQVHLQLVYSGSTACSGAMIITLCFYLSNTALYLETYAELHWGVGALPSPLDFCKLNKINYYTFAPYTLKNLSLLH